MFIGISFSLSGVVRRQWPVVFHPRRPPYSEHCSAAVENVVNCVSLSYVSSEQIHDPFRKARRLNPRQAAPQRNRLAVVVPHSVFGTAALCPTAAKYHRLPTVARVHANLKRCKRLHPCAHSHIRRAHRQYGLQAWRGQARQSSSSRCTAYKFSSSASARLSLSERLT